MRTIYLMTFAAGCLLAGCVPVPVPAGIEDVDMPFYQEVVLADGEAVTVFSTVEDRTGRDDIADCLREGLEEADPPVRVIPAGAFRDTLFPWFEPETVPRSDEDWAALLARPLVKARVAELDVRFLLEVQGSHTEGETKGVEAVAVGAVGVEVRDRVTAKLRDLKGATSVGAAAVESASHDVLVHVMLYGIILLPMTETAACQELGRQLAAAFNGASAAMPAPARETMTPTRR
jgi:hypothetical protein